jgi:hypothetical protein
MHMTRGRYVDLTVWQIAALEVALRCTTCLNATDKAALVALLGDTVAVRLTVAETPQSHIAA